jgi:hypothetical protein
VLVVVRLRICWISEYCSGPETESEGGFGGGRRSCWSHFVFVFCVVIKMLDVSPCLLDVSRIEHFGIFSTVIC